MESSSKRLTAAFVFCDLVDSSGVLARREAGTFEQFDAVMDALMRAVRLSGGVVVKKLGDGFMASFASAADAVEGSCELMRTARRLDRRGHWPVHLRLGASVGEATASLADTETDFIGLPVVEAARLCDLARADEALVTDRLVQVAATAITLASGPPTPTELRGIPEPVLVRSLAWQEMPPSRPMPVVVARAQAGAMVGRETVLTAVTDHLVAVPQEGRRLALVAGEPGIGKTRLASAAAESTSRALDGVVLYGSCHPSYSTPFQPFSEALGAYLAGCDTTTLDYVVAQGGSDLARVLPQLGRRLHLDAPALDSDPSADRLRLFEAIDATLARMGELHPVVLLLEDLHWAGTTTLQLLRFLARSPRWANLGVVATYRDTEIADSHPLRAALADLHRSPAVIAHRLRGLGATDVARLIDSHAAGPEAPAEDGAGVDPKVLDLADQLRRETGGNPYFIHAVLGSLGRAFARRPDSAPLTIPVPDSIRDLVLDQLVQLGQPGRATIEAASVIGPSFDVEVLDPVMAGEAGSRAAGDLAGGLARHLLTELGPGRYEFAHALVRSTIYQELPSDRLRRLHLGVGTVLEAMADRPDANPAALAHHFLGAGPLAPSGRVADHALQAAQQAMDQFAYEEAVDLLERALRALEADPDHDALRRCDALLLCAEAQGRGGDGAARRRTAMAAADLARSARSPRHLARAASLFGDVGIVGERDQDGIDLCEEALAALGPEDHDERTAVVGLLATLRSFAGDLEAADAATREAVEAASASTSASARARALFSRYHFLWGSPRASEQLAIAHALAGSDVVVTRGVTGAVESHRLRLYPAFVLGRMDEFLIELAEVERLAAEVHDQHMVGMAALWRSMTALFQGRFEDFDGGFDATAAAVASSDDLNLQNSLNAQFYFRCFEQGSLAGLVPMLEAFCERAPGLVGLQAALALSYHAAGRGDEAGAVLAELSGGDFAAVPHDLVRPSALATIMEVAVRLGDTERAAVLARLTAPYQGQLLTLSTAFCAGAADRFLGMAHHLAGRFREAENHYLQAIELEDSVGAVPSATRSRAWYARLLAERAGPGDADRAENLVGEVAQVATRLGLGDLAIDLTSSERGGAPAG